MARCELSADTGLHFIEQVIGLLRALPATSVRGLAGIEVPRVVWDSHGDALRAIARGSGLVLGESHRFGIHADSVWLVVGRAETADRARTG